MVLINDYDTTNKFTSKQMYDRLHQLRSNEYIFNFLNRVDNGVCNETTAMQILIYELAEQNRVMEKSLMDLFEDKYE